MLAELVEKLHFQVFVGFAKGEQTIPVEEKIKKLANFFSNVNNIGKQH